MMLALGDSRETCVPERRQGVRNCIKMNEGCWVEFDDSANYLVGLFLPHSHYNLCGAQHGEISSHLV